MMLINTFRELRFGSGNEIVRATMADFVLFIPPVFLPPTPFLFFVALFEVDIFEDFEALKYLATFYHKRLKILDTKIIQI